MTMGMEVAFIGPFLQKTEIYKFHNVSTLYYFLQEPRNCFALTKTPSLYLRRPLQHYSSRALYSLFITLLDFNSIHFQIAFYIIPTLSTKGGPASFTDRNDLQSTRSL